jgi:hypothetical protein
LAFSVISFGLFFVDLARVVSHYANFIICHLFSSFRRISKSLFRSNHIFTSLLVPKSISKCSYLEQFSLANWSGACSCRF